MTLTIEKPVQGTPFGLRFYNGVVTSTDQGGPAEKAGLKVDDRLFSVSGAPVQDVAAGEVTATFRSVGMKEFAMNGAPLG